MQVAIIRPFLSSLHLLGKLTEFFKYIFLIKLPISLNTNKDYILPRTSRIESGKEFLLLRQIKDLRGATKLAKAFAPLKMRAKRKEHSQKEALTSIIQCFYQFKLTTTSLIYMRVKLFFKNLNLGHCPHITLHKYLYL